ncbi:MAG: acyl carrier protein [Bacteroidota bacterium]
MGPSEQKIKSKLVEVAAKVSGCSSCVVSTEDLHDICNIFGFDSLGFMEFICAVEKEFGIQFREEATFAELNDLSILINEIRKLVE